MALFEDDSPMVAHRSHFDTMPCPPPDGMQVLTTENSTFHLSAQGRESLAAHGVSLPATLSFEGRDVVIEQPTREALVLSAQQWSRALRDHAVDWNAHTDAARGMFDRLDAVLAELARML